MDDYLGRVHALVISISDRFTAEEMRQVQHLIDHGEPAEGLRALAWFTVDRNRTLPHGAIASIRELTVSLIPAEHMPPDLEAHAES
jgi:hypothetical protein